MIFRQSTVNSEDKVRSGSKRTLDSYHETQKDTGLELLGSQSRSG